MNLETDNQAERVSRITPDAHSTENTHFDAAPTLDKNETDYTTYIDDLISKAEAGEVDAQTTLGYIYYYGVDVEKDLKKVFYWSDKAAKNGSVDAQFNLGWL